MHDPQPAATLPLRGRGRARWIWRCHIDISQPNAQVWAFLRPFLSEYDAAIFTMAELAPPDMPTRKIEIIPPAIDPSSPKNLPLPTDTARQVLEWLGIRTDRPLVTQISRFDPWKDPLGVIEAYRTICDAVPDLQVVLAGSLALDDPEGREVYRSIRAKAGGDPRIHVFTNLVGVGNIEVNALQMLSDVVVQSRFARALGWSFRRRSGRGRPWWPVGRAASRSRWRMARAASWSTMSRSARPHCGSCLPTESALVHSALPVAIGFASTS
jgi:trehalose synthase